MLINICAFATSGEVFPDHFSKSLKRIKKKITIRNSRNFLIIISSIQYLPNFDVVYTKILYCGYLSPEKTLEMDPFRSGHFNYRGFALFHKYAG